MAFGNFNPLALPFTSNPAAVAAGSSGGTTTATQPSRGLNLGDIVNNALTGFAQIGTAIVNTELYGELFEEINEANFAQQTTAQTGGQSPTGGPAPVNQGGLPEWFWPVAGGVGVLAALVLLYKLFIAE